MSIAPLTKRPAPTVLVTAPALAAAGADLLQQAGFELLYLPKDKPEDALSTILASTAVDAVISRTVDLTAQHMESCPSLRIICKHGVGVSNIDVAAASQRGIPVCITPGANAQSVAEMTCGLMFATARRIAWIDAELRDGRWSRVQDGLELHGRTLGLVGFGAVGQKVANVALALGMKVMAFDPAPQLVPAQLSAVQMLSSPDAVVQAADILSLHVPLNHATRGMLNAERIQSMRAGSILINTARGEVVDEVALIAALRSGHLRAAGLDTMSVEPLPAGHALLLLPNVVLTPHVGGSTPAALNAMALGAAQTVQRFLLDGHLDSSTCINTAALSAFSEANTL